VPFQCPSPPDQDGGAKRWAEPSSLEDSCPSYAPGLPDQDGGAIRRQWPFDKGSASLMKSE
jgi:hypothetical protein